ncbi:hypothetical protein QFZ41_002293 [Luteibacter sp. W1I16]
MLVGMFSYAEPTLWEPTWWEPTLSAIPRQRARSRQAPIADKVGSHQVGSTRVSVALGACLNVPSPASCLAPLGAGQQRGQQTDQGKESTYLVHRLDADVVSQFAEHRRAEAAHAE